jgi:hypothetical protein
LQFNSLPLELFHLVVLAHPSACELLLRSKCAGQKHRIVWPTNPVPWKVGVPMHRLAKTVARQDWDWALSHVKELVGL